MRKLLFEALESRLPLSGVAAMDVNLDYAVDAADVLEIVNGINAEASPVYHDVSGDGRVTALDPLVVINQINAHGAVPAAAELEVEIQVETWAAAGEPLARIEIVSEDTGRAVVDLALNQILVSGPAAWTVPAAVEGLRLTCGQDVWEPVEIVDEFGSSRFVIDVPVAGEVELWGTVLETDNPLRLSAYWMEVQDGVLVERMDLSRLFAVV